MKKQILLIDDDQDELDLFVQALEGVPGSFTCSFAASAEQALLLLEHLQPDYIFIDYNLPKVNGLELLKNIKNDKRLSSIPVFLYSTHINLDTMQEAMRSGAAGCIEKPQSIGMMSKVLRSVLVPENNL